MVEQEFNMLQDGEKMLNMSLNVPISDTLERVLLFQTSKKMDLPKIYIPKLLAIWTIETVINGVLLFKWNPTDDSNFT